MPGELGLVLHAPAADEVLAVGRDLDPVGAQVVGDLEREGRGHGRPARRRSAGPREGSPRARSPPREPLRVELVDAELLVAAARSSSGATSATRSSSNELDDDVLLAVPLRVEERIRTRQRHLVPHLGRAHGVGVDQDVCHGGPDRTSRLANRGGGAPEGAVADRRLRRGAGARAAQGRRDLRRARPPRARHRRHDRGLRGPRADQRDATGSRAASCSAWTSSTATRPSAPPTTARSPTPSARAGA